MIHSRALKPNIVKVTAAMLLAVLLLFLASCGQTPPSLEIPGIIEDGPGQSADNPSQSADGSTGGSVQKDSAEDPSQNDAGAENPAPDEAVIPPEKRPGADTEAPVIMLTGCSPCVVMLGEPYSDPGFSVADNTCRDEELIIRVSGSVDTSVIGENTIVYEVEDLAGNIATASRTVYVYTEVPEGGKIVPSGKTVYLTYDDGPAEPTARLLDILDKYGVKVTFFTTSSYPEYTDMIGREYKAGHTVAAHSYTHVWKTVYASVDVFKADLEKQAQVIYEQTGSRPWLMRFAGGSSNKVSRSYVKGLMTTLVGKVKAWGYTYTDWNVDVGDGGKEYTLESIIARAKKGIASKKVPIVLMHDRNETTVDAAEDIILYCIIHGHELAPMTPGSPVAKHRLNN